MDFKKKIKILVKKIIKPFQKTFFKKKNEIDYYLYKYNSYEEYKNEQVLHNKRKLNNIWADKKTLTRVADILFKQFGRDIKIKGLCHGSRNGFEQNYLRSISKNIEAVGTDISDTAVNYENSLQWDFHEINEEWTGQKDFIYTNSLDQSWQPKKAIEIWFSQLKKNGLLIIEHTDAHGPEGASKMDPFGVRPKVMPYILTMWFGSQISIEHSVDTKDNINLEAWLYILRKNVPNVLAIK